MQVEVIAEIGCNHNGSMDLAKMMIGNAKLVGADAVKFQFYSTDEIIEYEKTNPNSLYTKDMFDWIRRTEFSIEQLTELKKICNRINIEFLCTPFINPERVDLLDPLVKRWKIRERDGRILEDNPLLEAACTTRKEILISTTRLPIKSHFLFHPNIKWLYCIPKYPAEFKDLVLSSIRNFDGYSNHIPDILAPLATMVTAHANAKERWIIEAHIKHNYLYQDTTVIDEEVSFTFLELRTLIDHIREINKCTVKNEPF